MRREAFSALAAVEREHWFYRGKRDIVRHWVEQLLPLRQDDVLIDVGAGTGQLLAEMSASCRAFGVESHPEGVAQASARRVPLVQGSIDELPLACARAAVVTALDVLEHVGDDRRALGELARITRPGGLIVLHVPAFGILWSDWDDALGHRRRYSKQSLLRLVNEFPLAVRRCVYVNTAAFPAIGLYRLVRARLAWGGRGHLEDRVPPGPLNRILHRCFVAHARWGWCSPPFGLSILCILQRPGGSLAGGRP